MKTKFSKRYRLLQKCIHFLGILTLILTGVLIVWLYRIGMLSDTTVLRSVIERYKLFGPLIFILIQIIQVVFPIIPGGLTTVAGFLVFGSWQGFLYNYIGIVIGSLILFALVKKYGRTFIFLFVKEKNFFKYEKHLESKKFETLFILSMISPISPADIMVMIAALTNISFKRFTIIMFITKPFSIVGYGALWIYGGDWIRRLL